MKLKDTLLCLLCVVLWGINSTAIKFGVSEFPPLFLTGFRFLIVSAILLPFFRPKKHELKQIFALSICLGIGHFGLLFVSAGGLDAGTISVLMQSSVPLCALMSAILFKDTFGIITAISIAVCIGGVYVIAGDFSVSSPFYLTTMLLSTTFWGIGSIMIKYIKDTKPIAMNAGMSFFAAFELFAISYFVENGQLEAIKSATIIGWSGLAFTVIGATLIAWSIWYYLIDKYDVNQVVFYNLLAPVSALITGYIALDEELTARKLIGGLMIISGIIVIQIRKIQKSRKKIRA